MSFSNRPGRRQRRPSASISGTIKTLATTAVVAYGAFKAYEYLREDDHWTSIPQWLSSLWLEDQHDEKEEEKNKRNTKKSSKQTSKIDHRTRYRLAQQSLRKCRRETLHAYATCWPALQQVLDDHTSTVTLTQELRTLRQSPKNSNSSGSSTINSVSNNNNNSSKQRQDELWQQIQLETITKFISTVYASSLLVLSLTMQLSWISGQVFEQQQQQQQQRHSDGVSTINTRLAHQVMIQSHQYMVSQGMPLLIAAIRRAISATPIEQWKPTTLLSQQDIDTVLDQVEKYLDRPGSTSHSRNWIRLVLPDPTILYDEEEHESDQGSSDIASILDVFWDLAESPAWQDAQLQTTQTIRQYLRDNGWGRLIDEATTNKETKVDGTDILETTHVPLAKMMAPFKASSGLVVVETGADDKKMGNRLLQKIQTLATVLELASVSFQGLQ